VGADYSELEQLPLLVGELNSYGSDPRMALYPGPKSSAGWRLCHKIMGVTGLYYLRAFERVNLCCEKWSMRAAREAAAEIVKRRVTAGSASRKLVLLGAKVCAAFRVPYEPFSIRNLRRGTNYVVLPHLSGRCRAWNEDGAVQRARFALVAAEVLRPGECSWGMDSLNPDLLGTDQTGERPVKCSNCGDVVAGRFCMSCGEP